MEQHEKLLQVAETIEITTNKTIGIMNCNYAYYNDAGLYFSLFNNAQDAWNYANSISFDVENRILDSVSEDELDKYLDSSDFISDYMIYITESNKDNMVLEYSMYSEEFMQWITTVKDKKIKYFNWVDCIYRVKQQTVIHFPALYKSLNSKTVVKFTGEGEQGIVVFSISATHEVGECHSEWYPYTDTNHWVPYVRDEEFVSKFMSKDWINVRYKDNGAYIYLGDEYKEFYDLKFKDTYFVHKKDEFCLEAFEKGEKLMVANNKGEPETVVTSFLEDYNPSKHYRLETPTKNEFQFRNQSFKDVYTELNHSKWLNKSDSWNFVINKVKQRLIELDIEQSKKEIVNDRQGLRDRIFEVFDKCNVKLAEELSKEYSVEELREACDDHIKFLSLNSKCANYKKFRDTHNMFRNAEDNYLMRGIKSVFKYFR